MENAGDMMVAAIAIREEMASEAFDINFPEELR